MSDMVNLVRVLTASTGTSTMTLGAAYSQLFMTSAEAGMVNGRTYTYLIVDGNDWELGKGVYTASGTTLSRVTVLASRIGGTLGTSKITLSGTAQVRIVESADDMGALRGTRAVTGTSDTLAQNDLGRAVTYSNASAIAVSLAQAGASSQFLDGWSVHVKNTGAGAVTITPTTSMINGAATLVLAQNMGAFVWSDGTNYHAYFFPVTKPLLAANNLADVASAETARANLGIVAFAPRAVRGLTGSRNSGTATRLDLAADSVTFIDPTTNLAVVKYAVTSTACDIATAGPAAGGRDQAAAFSSGATVHFYWIATAAGATVSLVASTVAPSVGPTLPATYTMWAYATTMVMNGSNLFLTTVRGAKVYYQTAAQALGAGVATSATAVATTTWVPATALSVDALAYLDNATANAGVYSASYQTISGSTQWTISLGVPSNGANAATSMGIVFPNVGQNIYYLNSSALIRSSLSIVGYSVPNGDT